VRVDGTNGLAASLFLDPRRGDHLAIRRARRPEFGIIETLLMITLVVAVAVFTVAWKIRRES
jgi:hypothetical protein